LSTLANAVAVLRLFSSEDRELSVTETSRRLSMPKSSASRLLAGMRDAGFIDVVGNPPRYRLGAMFFEVASQYRTGSSLADRAGEQLSAICRDSGHTGYISILQGTDIIVLRARQGTKAIQVVTPLGQRLAAAETAIGRALLARLSDEEVTARYKAGFVPSSPNSPQTLGDLLAALADIRASGWSEAIDEAVREVGSAAVAVADAEGRDMVGLCLSYSASLVSQEERGEVKRLLVEAARALAVEVHDSYWQHPGGAGLLKQSAQLR
jgi:DNA-binding IclR family transcriptional regulator